MTRARKSVIRQGNVLLIPVNNTKISGNKLFRIILATKEVTDYYFRISKGQGEFYERDGVLYLRVISPQATLKYEGQKVLEIPQGYWMIHVIQREYPSDSNESYFLPIPLVAPNIECHNNSPSSSLNGGSLSSNLSAEIQKLAAQVDADYWEKIVTDAEKRKEYLQCKFLLVILATSILYCITCILFCDRS